MQLPHLFLPPLVDGHSSHPITSLVGPQPKFCEGGI